MTREEAWRRTKGYLYDGLSGEEADEIIKALEQEPCDDAISRQAVLGKAIDYGSNTYLIPVNSVKALPPATPQPKTGWIPVSKKLPEKSGNYWCTFGGTNLTGKDYYTTESDAKKFFDDAAEYAFGDVSEYAGWRSQNVIAWMPLPAPFEPQERRLK